MSATTTIQRPAYARRGDCPSWCVEHAWDVLPGREPIFQSHEGQLSRGGRTLLLSRSPEGLELVDTAEGLELSPGDALDYAALLVEAHGVLKRG